jgi:DNA-binding NtrC family response regulator
MTTAETILIGESLPIRRLRRAITRIATAKLPVLIEGATGTGKELAATLLHQLSGRRGAFVAFNVCALGESMFEDALFGHVRGAYTGAANDSPGFFREAHGGTVFLDEIGGLPGALQAKLLRAIETGVFRPIGASRDSTSDFRIVTATNEPMPGLVRDGRFRADLAFRLSGVVLTMPTLNERPDDIPLLVAHFARGVQVEPIVVTRLQQLEWEGNVRELKQLIDSSLVFSRGRLDADALDQALSFRSHARSIIPVPPSPVAADDKSAERTFLVDLMRQAAWDTERAAANLCVHRSTLYRRLKRYGISVPAPWARSAEVPAEF